jgi:hypothetical protein
MSAATEQELEVREAQALDAYSRIVVGVAEEVSPSVASLRLMRRTRGGRMPSGAGSAVVLSPDGFLLTNGHVVGGQSRTGRASFLDGRDASFELVGIDRLSDLAVVRADARDLAPARLGEAEALRVGLAGRARPCARSPRRGRGAARRPARRGDREPKWIRRLGDSRRRIRPRTVTPRSIGQDVPLHRQRDPD